MTRHNMTQHASLAQQLSDWRHAQGLTQAQAAAECGISLRTYQEYEQGRYEPRSALARNALLQKVQTFTLKGKP
jgi:transcriptional regulator with XRE-family HTH domain